MAKNLLVISVETKETRVALIENGIIAELHIERGGSHAPGGTVGTSQRRSACHAGEWSGHCSATLESGPVDHTLDDPGNATTEVV